MQADHFGKFNLINKQTFIEEMKNEDQDEIKSKVYLILSLTLYRKQHKIVDFSQIFFFEDSDFHPTKSSLTLKDQ